MSSGISALCRACPRLASRHARQAAARSSTTASHLKPRSIALNRNASPRSYATVSSQKQHSPKPSSWHRNKNIKWAFQNPDPERRERELVGAFVSSPREYPSDDMTALNEKERKKEANKLAGAYAIWAKSLRPKHFLVDRLEWTDTHDVLKSLTPRSIDDDNRVSAMRIVLSESLVVSDSLGKGVSFVNSVTGILEKMRVVADAKTPNEVRRRSFVLRGGRRALSQAVDGLSKTHEGVEVFELGDVATTDYHTQRLWPTKDELSEEELKSFNRPTRDLIWLHEELEPQWITRKLSSSSRPKPEKGNPQAFEAYITDLVRDRIRTEHVVPLHFEGYGHGWNKVDVGAARAQMIMEAFEDPEYHSSITSTSLKRALSVLARVDGHRGKAKRLFRLAESLGLPMDTESYNMMLEGIATTGDYRDFHKWVTKMKTCEFEPNARTWLIFLRLVKKDDVRQQIVSSMYERNLLVHQSVRRGVAAIMASTDAHQSFKSGSSLKQFIKEHNRRFGYKWYTREALYDVLKEYFRYFRNVEISVADWTFLVEQRFEDGERLDTEHMSPLVELCVERGDWVGAIWCVNFMETRGMEFDDKTMRLLMKLAVDTSNHYALTAAVFHGAHHRAINSTAKPILKFALLNKKEDNPWRETRIPLYTASMADAMRTRNQSSTDHLVDQITDVYRRASDEQKLVPAETLAMSLMSALSLQHQAAGAKTADLPALEIPMKLSGESDDDVKEIFKFDSTVKLLEENAQKSKTESVEEATESALENNEDQDPALEDIALAAEEDTTLTPKKQKPVGFQQFSHFQKGLNSDIPKSLTSTSPTSKSKSKSSSHANLLSQQERQMLSAIRSNSTPRPGNEALRLAREAERSRRRDNVRVTTQKPWLYDNFHAQDAAVQQQQTAEWLFDRYREIKKWDKRNVDYVSRTALMIRAQKELEEAEAQGIDLEDILKDDHGKGEGVNRLMYREEGEGDVQAEVGVRKKGKKAIEPNKWGYYEDDEDLSGK